MTNKFKCDSCGLIFEDEGIREEYNSPVYGPCWKIIAHCPSCNEKAEEFRQPKNKKSSQTTPSCGGDCSCCHAQG